METLKKRLRDRYGVIHHERAMSMRPKCRQELELPLRRVDGDRAITCLLCLNLEN